MSTQEPTEEQIRAVEEQLRRVDVPSFLLETTVSLINVGGFKLAEQHDLEQAKAAIEATRALLPLLPEEAQAQLKPILSQLQMAFVRESRDPGGQPEGGDEPSEEPRQADAEAERAKARAKIWTPPGA